MDNINSEKINYLKKYAEETYSESFNLLYFTEALDSTYNDIASFKRNDGMTFNVYLSDSGDIYDDYKLSELGWNFTNKLKDSNNWLQNQTVNSVVMPGKNDTIQKAIVVICVEESIDEIKEDLFIVYNDIINNNPLKLEMDVISTKKLEDELSKIVNNPNGFYDNGFYRISGIDEYLVITDMTIEDSDNLVKEVVKK